MSPQTYERASNGGGLINRHPTETASKALRRYGVVECFSTVQTQ